MGSERRRGKVLNDSAHANGFVVRRSAIEARTIVYLYFHNLYRFREFGKSEVNGLK
jgi:hypothetical protein